MASRSRPLEWITAVAVVVVLVAGVTAAVVRNGEDDIPSEWDARVLDLVHFVERERGAVFDHPVPVDFLTPEEYSDRTRTDKGSLSEDETKEIEQFEGELRALGILSGDTSLLDATNDLTDTGTLAYYESGEERVVVRGTEVTPGLAVTLVHELTHALQDQVFAIDRYREADEEPTSGETFAFDSLVEGDADRIDQLYTASLDQATQDAIDAENEAGYEEYQAATDDVPVALDVLFGALYGLGDSFVAFLDSAGESVDGAFDDPPVTEEQVFDAFAYLDGDEPVAVDVPDTDGEEAFDDGDFGAVSLMVVLAERIEPRQALAAATGWGGDAYVVFPRDGRTCIRLDVTGDSPTETDELADALADWVAAAPGSAATTSRTGDIVHLESCDPGVGSAEGTGGSALALDLAVTRSYAAADALDDGADPDAARCFGSAIVEQLTDDELADESPTPAVRSKVGDIIDACG
ncbi:MAG: hypothetical protein QOH36_579 [Actinomycetota bacterium]|nr:hypothetical protein [Actinomycetota bacterium]